MLKSHAKLLSLLEVAGEIKTRKKIQKIIYLLKQKKAPFTEDFTLHHYGPYSSELQIELDQLEDSELIQPTSSLDAEVYKFNLSEEAKKLLENNRTAVNKLQVNNFNTLIKELNKFEPSLLESMATIVYFEKSYGIDKEKLKKAVLNIKPHLKNIFDNAWSELDRLELHINL